MVDPTPWTAPLAPVPVNATVTVPGSKSETNRALILAALADEPSVISGGLEARDTRLMRDALAALGVRIEVDGDRWQVTPPEQLTAAAEIDCGLAGTVMRFLPAVAALADGATRFDGDPEARVRPMAGLLDGLVAAGAGIDGDGVLPFTVHGNPQLPGGAATVDSSPSSQFVSGLLLAAPRFTGGLDLRHVGDPIPSRPNIEMTVRMLAEHGVRVETPEDDRWIVPQQPIRGGDFTVTPDLANAAPFLAAAAITGGRISVPNWPAESDQPGRAITDILALFGADVRLDDDVLTVQGTGELHAVDLDLRDASELTPVVAVLAAFADHTSHIRGVAHIRGHETDRLAALERDLDAVGAEVSQTDDGLRIQPKLLRSNQWLSYADHRMVTAGALLGLVVDEIELDDVGCVGKTLPDFVGMWDRMLADSVRAEQEAGRA